MKAGVLRGEGVRIEEVPEPEPGPGQLLIAVRAAGICGSDLSAARSGIPEGTVLGHEIYGEVLAVGEGTTDWRPGQRLTAMPVRGCGHCAACLTGRPTQCPQAQLLGITVPGGFAERVVVGAREALPISADVPVERGALAEPLAVGLHTVLTGELAWRDRVLVIGAGPVGLAVTVWAAALGARAVVVSDPVAARRAIAERCGADATIDPVQDDLAKRARALLGGPPDLVVECAGGRVAEGLRVVGRNGRVVVAAYSSAEQPVEVQRNLLKETTLRFASWYEREEWDHVVNALERDRLPVDGMVTHTVALDELPDLYDQLKRPSDQGKVLVVP